MSAPPVTIRRVLDAPDRKRFVELAYELNRDDPHWVPPLRDEVRALIDPRRNPWFEHAKAALFLAMRDGRPVGRISAQVDQLVLEHMGPGSGQWGMFEAADEEAAHALLAAAEAWLAAEGMTRALGPFSLGIWDEPGLLIAGHDHAPMVMMGHHKEVYQQWVERAGHEKIKDLLTYDLDVTRPFPPLVRRIVESGEKNPRIRVRKIDTKRFDEEAALVLALLNDAWSDNWGFIPLTKAEIAHAGKKMKPIVLDEIIRVAEYDGKPVAFMLSLPDINPVIRQVKGRLFPFGWARVLFHLKRRRFEQARVALMGVSKSLQSSRLASQLAFMLIEHIRRGGTAAYGVKRAEVGWILEDNQGMISIADAIDSRCNRRYRIYEKTLGPQAG